MGKLLLSFLTGITILTNINLQEVPKELDKDNVSEVGVVVVNVDKFNNENIIEKYSFKNIDEFEKFNLSKALK